MYSYIKSHQRGFQGKLHDADAELGFIPIPNARGAMIFPVGEDLPVQYDENGFRVPINRSESAQANRHPTLLTLGCSFTYGDANLAEETYPYLIEERLGGTTRNAGFASYGLVQMLILARKLTPRIKPDYLLVQYSPWLTWRAQNQFAPAYYGKLPNPYFFSRSDHPEIHRPVFLTKIFSLPIDRYRQTPASLSDRMSFMFRVGLPLFFHDDLNMGYYQLQEALGAVPEPASNTDEITRYVYEEMAQLAKANGARLVIVILGGDEKEVPIPDKLFPSSALVVNAQHALIERLPTVNAETYARLYFHWRGNPPQMVDGHPNADAHRIIAEAIVHRIEEDRRQAVPVKPTTP